MGLALNLLNVPWTSYNLGEQAILQGKEQGSKYLVVTNENNETKLRINKSF